MNRKERRAYAKTLKSQNKISWNEAKHIADQYTGYSFSRGEKCKFNYELIHNNSSYKKQKEEFIEWVESHKDQVLTIDKVRHNGMEVTFVEDTNKVQFWHHSITLTPITTAKITLNDGTVKEIALDDINDIKDPNFSAKINEQVNKALESE